MKTQMNAAENLSTPYAPVALYLEESDSVEYVRVDCACVYKRVDPLLTLVLDMKTRHLIGFRLKGFKNFYLRSLRDGQDLLRSDFLLATSVLEKALEMAAKQFFKGKNDAESHRNAYKNAWQIALDDKVELHDLPLAA